MRAFLKPYLHPLLKSRPFHPIPGRPPIPDRPWWSVWDGAGRYMNNASRLPGGDRELAARMGVQVGADEVAIAIAAGDVPHGEHGRVAPACPFMDGRSENGIVGVNREKD